MCSYGIFYENLSGETFLRKGSADGGGPLCQLRCHLPALRGVTPEPLSKDFIMVFSTMV